MKWTLVHRPRDGWVNAVVPGTYIKLNGFYGEPLEQFMRCIKVSDPEAEFDETFDLSPPTA